MDIHDPTDRFPVAGPGRARSPKEAGVFVSNDVRIRFKPSFIVTHGSRNVASLAEAYWAVHGIKDAVRMRGYTTEAEIHLLVHGTRVWQASIDLECVSTPGRSNLCNSLGEKDSQTDIHADLEGLSG